VQPDTPGFERVRVELQHLGLEHAEHRPDASGRRLGPLGPRRGFHVTVERPEGVAGTVVLPGRAAARIRESETRTIRDPSSDAVGVS
jgi:hypothetical protein